jgi:hypothetical protein
MRQRPVPYSVPKSPRTTGTAWRMSVRCGRCGAVIHATCRARRIGDSSAVSFDGRSARRFAAGHHPAERSQAFRAIERRVDRPDGLQARLHRIAQDAGSWVAAARGWVLAAPVEGHPAATSVQAEMDTMMALHDRIAPDVQPPAADRRGLEPFIADARRMFPGALGTDFPDLFECAQPPARRGDQVLGRRVRRILRAAWHAPDRQGLAAAMHRRSRSGGPARGSRSGAGGRPDECRPRPGHER